MGQSEEVAVILKCSGPCRLSGGTRINNLEEMKGHEGSSVPEPHLRGAAASCPTPGSPGAHLHGDMPSSTLLHPRCCCWCAQWHCEDVIQLHFLKLFGEKSPRVCNLSLPYQPGEQLNKPLTSNKQPNKTHNGSCQAGTNADR